MLEQVGKNNDIVQSYKKQVRFSHKTTNGICNKHFSVIDT